MGKSAYSPEDLISLREAMRERCNTLIANADSDTYAAGMEWYADTKALCTVWAKSTGYSVDQVVAVFAVMSPQISYAACVQATQALVNGLQPEQGLGENIFKSEMILETGEIDTYVKGPKVRAFYENVLNPKCPKNVTIDSWMRAIVGIKSNELARNGCHQALIDGVKLSASDHGILPLEAQAIAWCASRGTPN